MSENKCGSGLDGCTPIKVLIRRAVEAEREACAKLVEKSGPTSIMISATPEHATESLAKQIRARGAATVVQTGVEKP